MQLHIKKLLFTFALVASMACQLSAQQNTHLIVMVDRSASFPTSPKGLLDASVKRYYRLSGDRFQCGAFHGSCFMDDLQSMTYGKVDGNLGKDEQDEQQEQIDLTIKKAHQSGSKAVQRVLTAPIQNAQYTMIAKSLNEVLDNFAFSSSNYRRLLIVATDLEQTSPAGSPYRNLKATPPRNTAEAITFAQADAVTWRKEINRKGLSNLSVLFYIPNTVGQSRDLSAIKAYWKALLTQIGIPTGSIYFDKGQFAANVEIFKTTDSK